MNNKGFTLIEAIVSLAIFIVISAALAQIIVVSIQNQIKITTTQNMFDQAIFALDKIEKELRMAKKDTDGGCVGLGNNYATSLNSITFLHHDQVSGLIKCKKFVLEGGKIREYISENKIATFVEGVDVTGDVVNVEDLRFNKIGDGRDDNLQPKITMIMKMKNKKIENSSSIMLQATISQRRLDL